MATQSSGRFYSATQYSEKNYIELDYINHKMLDHESELQHLRLEFLILGHQDLNLHYVITNLTEDDVWILFA